MKSVRIWSYSGPYFPAFGLNTERYQVSLRIHSNCRKIRTRITPNTDTFYAVTFMEEISPNPEALCANTSIFSSGWNSCKDKNDLGIKIDFIQLVGIS